MPTSPNVSMSMSVFGLTLLLIVAIGNINCAESNSIPKCDTTLKCGDCIAKGCEFYTCSTNGKSPSFIYDCHLTDVCKCVFSQELHALKRVPHKMLIALRLTKQLIAMKHLYHRQQDQTHRPQHLCLHLQPW